MARQRAGTVWPMPRKGQKRTAPKGLRVIVARNLRKLMVVHEELKTATALGKASRIGRKTVGRMMDGTEHAITLDSLEAVAGALRVLPWQMLVEDMDARALPQLRVPTGKEAEFYSTLGELGKAMQRIEEIAPPGYRRGKKAQAECQDEINRPTSSGSMYLCMRAKGWEER